MADLGPRLEAALSFLPEAARLADVGADHGFLAIEAVARGKARSAIAIDDKPGPLAKATENVALAGLSDRIRTVLCDGLPDGHGCDAVAILGMGGAMIARILGAADMTVVRRLVLGPQSEAAVVRAWLETHGFAIEREAFVVEREKHYQIIAAVPGRMVLTAAEREFGPLILKEKNAAFRAYVAGLVGALERGRAAAADPVKRRLLQVRIDFLRELIP